MTVFSLDETDNEPYISFHFFSNQCRYPIHRITTLFLSRVQSCCSSSFFTSSSSSYLSGLPFILKYSLMRPIVLLTSCSFSLRVGFFFSELLCFFIIPVSMISYFSFIVYIS